jgi:hypothetical protein
MMMMMMQELQMELELNHMQELQMELELLNKMQELQIELELNQMQEHKSAEAYAGVCEPSKFPWCPDLGATAQTHNEDQRQHE